MSLEFITPKFDQNQSDQYLDALSQPVSSKLGVLSGGTPQKLPKGLAIASSFGQAIKPSI